MSWSFSNLRVIKRPLKVVVRSEVLAHQPPPPAFAQKPKKNGEFEIRRVGEHLFLEVYVMLRRLAE